MGRAHRAILVASGAAAIFSCASFKRAEPDAGVAGDGGEEGAVDAGLPDTGFTIVRQNPEAGAFRALWVGSTETVYIGGDNGALIEKKNEGDGWADVVLGSGVDVTGIWASGTTEALAVATTRNTNNGPIFRRSNNRWVQIGTAPHGLRSVWGFGNMRYASGNDGVVYSG